MTGSGGWGGLGLLFAGGLLGGFGVPLGSGEDDRGVRFDPPWPGIY